MDLFYCRVMLLPYFLSLRNTFLCYDIADVESIASINLATVLVSLPVVIITKVLSVYEKTFAVTRRK